ncbi:MAG TPA: LPS assembly protein LptD [Xanthomonadales bacterium]|nr:LPS assembly protein LptD [Xanthomonadales bacterium]
MSLLLAAPAAAAFGEGDWSLCRKNALFDFYRPDLPTGVDRETAPTEFSAASLLVTEKSKYRLEGDVEATRADQRLAADTLFYDETAARIEAVGDVQYQDQTLLMGADKAVSEIDANRTVVEGVRYQLLAARGNGTAERAELVDDETTHLERVMFTTCDPGDADWQLLARSIELDHAKGEGVARGMRLRFKNVTVFALPYATFPINDQRKTGFLYPKIGGASNSGFDFGVPYYINIAPNYDATLVPRIISDRGVMLGGEFRYLEPNHRGEVAFTYLPDDDRNDRDRHSFRIDHASVFSPNFYALVDINEVSDDRYFEDFGDSLAATATSLLPSSAYLLGRGTWWTLAFGADDYEVTDPRLAPGSEPYRRLPRFVADAEYRFTDYIAAGLESELVRFDKDDAIDGSRVDLFPYVAFPVERSGWYVRPQLGVRYTSYEIDNIPDSPTRSTAIASLDAGLFFDRPANLFGRDVRQTLEPRLYYLYVPFEDQTDIPIFDTQEYTFSFAQLFRPNRFSGADRQMDANQVTVALTSRLIDDAAGQELLRASIGQIRYFDEQEVQLPGVPPTDFSRSAWAGELDVRLADDWNVAVSHQYDPEDHETDLSAIRVQRRFGERSVANLAYRFRRDVLEQLDASAAFPITERLRLVARWNYSLRDHNTLEAFGGIEFESCCYAIRVLGRHYVRNVEGDRNNGIYAELEFKGLGAIGRKTGDFLQRAILGYR